jgi:formamidopyrimidine-DNA glycosylase
MPELPDLLHIQRHLQKHLTARVIQNVSVRQPVVIRSMIAQPIQKDLPGRRITGIAVHGPFLRIDLSGEAELVIHLMLAGRIQHQVKGDRPIGYLCVSFRLEDGSVLHVADEQKMAKVYLIPSGAEHDIPRYADLGIDVLSPSFTLKRFRELTSRHRRKQVRTFINDHTILSAIGNAYADEILFDAGIHPKTFLAKLSEEEADQLYRSILIVLRRGIRHVEHSDQPIHKKVRDHMQVRNQKGKPCPRCGSIIRREGVRGYDVFFCPRCQPATRKLFIDWRSTTP